MPRMLLCLIVVITACSGSTGTAPKPVPLDPPAAVHVVNASGVPFHAWTMIAGADANHSGTAPQGTSDTTPGWRLCLGSGSTTGERTFIEAAVEIGSRLDSALQAQHGLPVSDPTAFLTSVP